jgi:formylglycine-generating enzyme required for sulfatase activity
MGPVLTEPRKLTLTRASNPTTKNASRSPNPAERKRDSAGTGAPDRSQKLLNIATKSQILKRRKASRRTSQFTLLWADYLSPYAFYRSQPNAVFAIIKNVDDGSWFDSVSALDMTNSKNASSISDVVVVEGKEVVVPLPQASSPEVSVKFGQQPPNSYFDKHNSTFVWQTREEHGPGTFPCKVEFVAQGKTIDSQTFTIQVKEENRFPKLAITTTRAAAGQTLKLDLRPQDSDIPINEVSVKLLEPIPGCRIDSKSQLNWDIPPGARNGLHEIAVTLFDGTDRVNSVVRIEVVNNQSTIRNSIGIEFVSIPAGSYELPSDPFSNSSSVSSVTIPNSFNLARHEVTRGQFREYIESTGYKVSTDAAIRVRGWSAKTDSFNYRKNFYSWRKPGFQQNDDHPVVLVSTNDARQFCAWLSEKEGRTYRLPTEEEWELCARGNTATTYSFGSNESEIYKYGNTGDRTYKDAMPKEFVSDVPDVDYLDDYVFTAPVGSFEPNPFGLFDMHGNVWELCKSERPGISWIRRGGAYNEGVEYSSCTKMKLNDSSGCGIETGFRIVLIDSIRSETSSSGTANKPPMGRSKQPPLIGSPPGAPPGGSSNSTRPKPSSPRPKTNQQEIRQ